MKKYASVISLLLIVATIYWSFSDMIPSKIRGNTTISTEFSLEKALSHLKIISQKPHYVGSKEHKLVQNYIVEQFKELGLSPKIQYQSVIRKGRKTLISTTVENIVVKIKGSEKGKSLMLLTHYDSSPHSSFGAGDAGSGVVTIMEGVRAFLASKKQPKNDIIILISDAEELGLLGAKAFVETHSLVENIGLILNFEARGSGGPSYLLFETNGKNSTLLSEFLKAKPNYPVANSLMYSIYKMLPNDTDLTIFREEANINGLNFAFIGDHFDYHTAQDTYERLDKETLAHQADYLMTLLNHFSNIDLGNLDSEKDNIYVNFPFIKMLKYPLSWVSPMLIIASILFIILVFLGFLRKQIKVKEVFKGFIPLLLSLVLCGGISFFLWKGLLLIHPQYNDILHGFTYNGYQYIIAFVFLNIWILFKIYKRFYKNREIASLLIAPILLWLVINFLIFQFLIGASFFIIPVYSALLVLAILVFKNQKEKQHTLLFAILFIPTVYIFAPLIKMFPVGLGLKSLFISGLFLALIFSLMLPVFSNENSRIKVTKLVVLLAIIFFVSASFNSGFDIDKRKPNSAVYISNNESNESYWATYDQTIDSYTSQFFNNKIERTKNIIAAESKYNLGYKQYQKTKKRAVKTAIISIEKDTIIEGARWVEILISPQRKINKISLKTKDSISFYSFSSQGVSIDEGGEYNDVFNVKNGTILNYHFGNSDKNLRISFSIPSTSNPSISVYETSYDLLTNPLFSISPREKHMMPKPFITNDAIITIQKIQL